LVLDSPVASRSSLRVHCWCSISNRLSTCRPFSRVRSVRGPPGAGSRDRASASVRATFSSFHLPCLQYEGACEGRGPHTRGELYQTGSPRGPGSRIVFIFKIKKIQSIELRKLYSSNVNFQRLHRFLAYPADVDG
jgi:hypothetical protein